MSIWKYGDTGLFKDHSYRSDQCLFCGKAMSCLWDETPSNVPTNTQHERVLVCGVCGWWFAVRRFSSGDEKGSNSSISLGSAVLRELDLAGEAEPLSDVSDYLTVKYSERNKVHPGVFEDVVASIYSDLGYKAVTTSRSRDDGVDVFLERDGAVCGVQVKRVRGKIGAEPIRALTGSLALAGLTEGVFVTTSRFTQGAVSTATRYSGRGYRLELVDADALFELLLLRRHRLGDLRDEIDVSRCLEQCVEVWRTAVGDDADWYEDEAYLDLGYQV